LFNKKNKQKLPPNFNLIIVNNKIAIFASGTGSNALKIIKHFRNKDLAEVALVLSNNAGAAVLQKAKEADIPALTFSKKELLRSSLLLKELQDKEINWIILAGFLLKIPEYLIERYPHRIINIHPALLPKYGGKGMYGSRVHQAVIAAGEKESGITIHYIDKHYDKGEIILQKKCAVSQEDDAESLAQKVQQLEHKWFPLAIEKIIKENIGK